MKSLLVFATVLGLSSLASGLDHSHVLFTEVLAAHVERGLVDYHKLKAHPEKLGAYLNLPAQVSKSDFDAWSSGQQMAFLINLYNAQALKLVVDHYPVRSIKNIGGFRGPFKLRAVHLWGGLKTLDDIEHGILRPHYAEPRIHFALVCAARSCPDLRSEAYQAEILSVQLDDQARNFLRQEDKNPLLVGNTELYLSRIFDWFEDDFSAAKGSVIKFILPYLPVEKASVISRKQFREKFVAYDWTLNELKN
ncbi:MAG: DUF547 domain-containing protein [Verrucomicrobiales bacterium]